MHSTLIMFVIALTLLFNKCTNKACFETANSEFRVLEPAGFRPSYIDSIQAKLTEFCANDVLSDRIRAEAKKQRISSLEMGYILAINEFQIEWFPRYRETMYKRFYHGMTSLPQWKAQIEEQAKETGWTLEKTLEKNARFMFKEGVDKQVGYVPVTVGVEDYLVLGHCYQHGTWQHIDKRLEQLYLPEYEMLLLGGDISAELTEDSTYLPTLDQKLDLGSEKTLWAVGNHDTRNGNVDWITNITGRKTYLAHYHKGITFLVLNTCFRNEQAPPLHESCDEMREQVELIRQVTDTIRQSSHLVVLKHHVVWGETVAPLYHGVSNYRMPRWQFLCDSASSFDTLIYPMLSNVQKRGVQVICLAGDMGMYGKEFEKVTHDGIVFLVTGINNSANKKIRAKFHYNGHADKVLVLHHDTTSHELTWGFYKLNVLVDQHQRRFKHLMGRGHGDNGVN